MTDSPAKIWGILPAAGVGARMGLKFPKQYLPLGDKTIIEHSIALMLSVSELDCLTVCLSAEDQHFSHLNIDTGGDRLRTTLGGDTRAQSVLNGLLSIQTLTQPGDWVLVHDAARPCLTLAVLERLITSLKSDPVGGILALKSKDTLKQANEGNQGAASISHTIDRSGIWQAQTPQMFRYRLLLEALEFCAEKNLEVTDEASALEYAGHSVKLIEGSAANIKVTNPEDQALAEFLLSRA